MFIFFPLFNKKFLNLIKLYFLYFFNLQLVFTREHFSIKLNIVRHRWSGFQQATLTFAYLKARESVELQEAEVL